jgi:hypothetical protein
MIQFSLPGLRLALWQGGCRAMKMLFLMKHSSLLMVSKLYRMWIAQDLKSTQKG